MIKISRNFRHFWISSNKKTEQAASHCGSRFLIKMSDEFGKEMDRMCNLSDLIEERGIQQGMQQGMQQGIQQGMQRGMQQGSEEKCRDMVRKMLRFGLMSDEDILKVAEISQEELERIRKDL